MFALLINVYYFFSQYMCVCLVHSVHLCVPLVTICWYTIFTMQCTISACIVNLSSSLNPIRSGGGGGALKAPPLRFFALTHLILELHYCALVTFPKK